MCKMSSVTNSFSNMSCKKRHGAATLVNSLAVQVERSDALEGVIP